MSHSCSKRQSCSNAVCLICFFFLPFCFCFSLFHRLPFQWHSLPNIYRLLCAADALMKIIQDLVALVKQLRDDIAYQRGEISHLRTLIENCAGCKEPTQHTCHTANPCYPGVTCHDTATGIRCGRCPSGECIASNYQSYSKYFGNDFSFFFNKQSIRCSGDRSTVVGRRFWINEI